MTNYLILFDEKWITDGFVVCFSLSTCYCYLYSYFYFFNFYVRALKRDDKVNLIEKVYNFMFFLSI
jgi:hypothetical protein